MKFFWSRKEKLFVGIIITLSLGLIYPAMQLGFDYNFDQLFPESEELSYYQSFQANYGSDNDYIIIALTHENSVYDSSFLKEVSLFQSKLNDHPNIESVNSLLNMQRVVKDPMLGSVFELDWINLNAENLSYDSIRIAQHPKFIGQWISKDQKSLKILIRHEAHLDEVKGDSLVQYIKKYIPKNLEYHLGGRIIGHVFYVHLTQRESSVFVGLSFLLIFISTFIIFRKWYFVLVPLIIVGLGVLYTRAILYLLGVDFNIILAILPTILLVVGISSAIHWIEKFIYIAQKYPEEDITAWINKSKAEINKALFFTNGTTIIGFLSLLTTGIPAIQEFAWIAAFGVMIIFLFCLSLLPLFLKSTLAIQSLPKSNQLGNRSRLIGKAFTLLHRKKALLLGAFTLVFLLSIWGISQMKTNNYILEDLPSENLIKKDALYFEQQFEGTRPFNLIYKPTHKDTLQQLRTLNSIDSCLTITYKSPHFFQLNSLIKEAYVVDKYGDYAQYKLPKSNKKLLKYYDRVMKNAPEELVNHFYNAETGSYHIQGLIGDIGSDSSAVLMQEFQNQLNNLGIPKSEIHFTGGPYLMEINNAILTTNVLKGILLAIILVAGIVWFLFKSFKMMLISMLPNLLPLVVIGGIMGFFGIDLKVSTSLVFTIALGIAVDDTIHVLSKYLLEIKKGNGVALSLKNTFFQKGKAVVVSTIILVSGFLILASSDFLGTVYIGLLVSVALIIALLADLFLLPILILMSNKRKPRNDNAK